MSWLALLFAAVTLHAATAPASVSTYVSVDYEVTHKKGLVRTPEGRRFLHAAPRVSYLTTPADVPKAYSVRGHAGGVEDQGGCGSCWVFALTTTLRGTWMTQGQDPGRLSFNYLLNCTPQPVGQGCDGGDFGAADLFVSPQGAPAYGSDGDYTGTASACTPATPVASTISYKLLGTDIGANPTSPDPSFRDIAYVVGVLHQPVSVDVAVNMDWEMYARGVYNGCSDEVVDDINHMVVIEGYDCETSVDPNGNCVFDANGNLPPGVGTWLIRNSWGTSWGDGGYITTKATDAQGKKCNAVANDALFFTVK